MGNPGSPPALRLTRRAALALLIGTGVAACSPADNTEPTPTPSPDPDALTRDDVAAQEWALVALYDAAIAAQPGQAQALESLRDQHVEHAAALGSSAPPTMPSSSTRPPADRVALAAAEEEASRARVTSCSRAVDADLARLLALIGASEAGHAAYLRTAST